MFSDHIIILKNANGLFNRYIKIYNIIYTYIQYLKCL
jgi:hypothetical protein